MWPLRRIKFRTTRTAKCRSGVVDDNVQCPTTGGPQKQGPWSNVRLEAVGDFGRNGRYSQVIVKSGHVLCAQSQPEVNNFSHLAISLNGPSLARTRTDAHSFERHALLFPDLAQNAR